MYNCVEYSHKGYYWKLFICQCEALKLPTVAFSLTTIFHSTAGCLQYGKQESLVSTPSGPPSWLYAVTKTHSYNTYDYADYPSSACCKLGYLWAQIKSLHYASIQDHDKLVGMLWTIM